MDKTQLGVCKGVLPLTVGNLDVIVAHTRQPAPGPAKGEVVLV
jgi:hypothetical protein